MTDFATLFMRVDATGMKVGEQALDDLTKKAGTAEAQVGGALDGVAKKAKRSLDETAVAVRKTASGFEQTAQGAKKVARETNAATGQMANLTSQFNDIAVMMAAGQNPIQLAMQQGTQINQIFSQMGGGKDVLRMIGSSLMQMISPLSLLTLGSIALGAAATQAFSSLGTGAKKLDDVLEDLTDSLSKARDMIGLLGVSKLHDEFGEATEQVQAMARALGAISMRRLNDDAKDLVKSFRAMYDGNAFLNRSRTEDMVALGLGRNQTRQLSGMVNTLGGAKTLEQQLAQVEKIREAFAGWAGPVEAMTERQRDYFAHLVDTEAALRRIVDTQKDAARAEEDLTRARLDAAMEYAGTIRQQWEARSKAVDDEVRALNRQAEINRLVAKYGGDSLQVTTARVQAEREAYAETKKTEGIAGDLHDRLMKAWDAANNVASVDMSGNITLAANEAARLVSNLNAAALIEGRTQMGKGGGRGDGWEEARRRAAHAAGRDDNSGSFSTYLDSLTPKQRYELEQRTNDLLNPTYKPPRGGGGGGRSSRRDQEAYGKSVQEIMQETEAFLAQADAMAKVATAGGDWERALAVIAKEQELLNAAQRSGIEMTPEVVGGIREMAEAYVEAEDRLQRMRDATERGQDAFKDFVGSVLDGADGMKKALASLLQEMAKVQLQNAAMKAMGAAGGGGFLGAIGTLLTPWGGGRATGGPVQAGTTYLVGEQGPEYVTMGANGYVTPNHALGGASSVSIHIDARGAVEGTAALIEQKIRAAIPQIVNQSVQGVRAQTARGG